MAGAAYDNIAEWYDKAIREGVLAGDTALPALLDLAGEVQGLQLCDLACGQGRVTRELAQRGATVLGVDLSGKLLELARKQEQAVPSGITYRQGDARTLEGLADGRFDGITCHLALMDIDDLAATFRAVRRALKSDGWFVFSITHPCFQTPRSRWTKPAKETIAREVEAYFEEGFWRSDNPHGVRGQVGAYHRMLSTYLNNLIEAGLQLERMVEPGVPSELVEKFPGYNVIPAVALIRCRKI
jgi:ubiquinone/menaquinone biosynthesis C-methylase UbiE